MSDVFSRMGRFRISRKLFGEENEQALLAIFGDGLMIPVRAEALFQYDCIEYVAYCRLFDKELDGYEAPLYDVQVDEITGEVKAKRMGEI